jgi:hypothetical protein
MSEFEGVATVAVTGTLPILSDTITKAITSSAESYVIAFAVITFKLFLATFVYLSFGFLAPKDFYIIFR